MNAKEIGYITRIKRYVLFDIGGTEYDELHIVRGKFVRIIKVDSAEKSTVSFTLEDDSNNVHISVIKKSSAMYKKYYKKVSEGKPFILIYTNGVAPVIHTHFMIENIDNVYDLCAQAVADLNSAREEKGTPSAASAKNAIANLPSYLQPCAERQLSFAKTYNVASNCPPINFESNDHIYQYYKSIKTTLPASTQMFLDKCFLSEDKRLEHKNRDRVVKILSFSTGYAPETVKPQAFRLALDKFVECQENAKKEIIKSISASAISPKNKGMKILLVGAPGVGRKKLVESIARIRHSKPYITIPYFSFSSLADASGATSLFQGATPGIIGKKLLTVNTGDATIFFEGIDRASNEENKNGTPDQALEEILYSSLYYDCYYEVDFSLASSWIFASADSEENLSKKIRDGFDKIIHIHPYLIEERIAIAKKHLIPDLIGSYEETTLFEDSTLRYIIENYCYDDGVNILKKSIETLYTTALEEDVDIYRHRYSYEKIDEILGKDRLCDIDEAVININKRSAFDEVSVASIDRILFNSTRNDREGIAETAKLQVKLLSSFLKPFEAPVFEYTKFMDAVNKTHHGMLEVKRSLAKVFSKHFRTCKGSNLLIISAPGQGKTTLIRSAAKAYGMKFVKVSCNGVSDSSVFKGISSSYKSSKPGRIIGSICETGKNVVVMLDEIDKISTSRDSSVASCLLDLLDEKIFTDYYFEGITFNLNNAIFIATANYMEQISPELLNRFDVVMMTPYTYEEKREILLNNVLPEVYEENLTDGIIFNDAAVDLLLDYSDNEDGVRTLVSNARRVVEEILITEDSHIVTEEDVKSILHTHKNVNRKMGF